MLSLRCRENKIHNPYVLGLSCRHTHYTFVMNNLDFKSITSERPSEDWKREHSSLQDMCDYFSVSIAMLSSNMRSNQIYQIVQVIIVGLLGEI